MAEISKSVFGAYVIGVVATLQGIAWLVGFDGAVFAFSSLIIGLTAGAILGFKFPTSK